MYSKTQNFTRVLLQSIEKPSLLNNEVQVLYIITNKEFVN